MVSRREGVSFRGDPFGFLRVEIPRFLEATRLLSMPIYKYECAECGHTFEDLASFSDPDPEACPSCQADAVTKLITGGNFILKGGRSEERRVGKECRTRW